MRKMGAAGLVVVCGVLASAPAWADYVFRFKGNDTGGIIAYSLATEADARQIAVDHCAKYNKVARFLSVQLYEGGYISFACRWVPYGPTEPPVRAAY